VDEPSIEEPLVGGNASMGVVRVGDTVRRPAHPWSRSVDALLEHFERVDVKGAPRALGYDEQSRQVLTFVEGHVDPDPSDLDLERVLEVGNLIRRLHDAAVSFEPPSGAVWNVLIAPNEESLICHHDLAPWNLVRTETHMTFIDWDGAGPGSRLWDVAYAAHGFVPLSPRSGLSDDAASQRLGVLVDGYGLEVEGRLELIEMLGPRVRSMYEFLRESHANGVEPWSRLWGEGHGDMWLEDAIYVEERRHVWDEALL
jgi:hypothetical protein